MAGFVGIVLVLLGAIGILTAAVAWSLVRKQFGWDSVSGTVCASKVHFNWERYEARIEYTYSYRGRAFRGQKVRSLSISVNWRAPAQKDVEKYPLGSTVTVFVNPENPWDAVLERGGDPRFLPWILSVSAILLAMGLLLWNGRSGVGSLSHIVPAHVQTVYDQL